ncbi:MAG TPA: nucleotidyltransferase domain-containing protein [Candidatus Paceibacterota bacterium]|nr:nucleotidyltransferase domain-containing protein [Candidatus Paceibacterota bacterium]
MFKEINNLRIFFEEPEREFHLREIARILKKNPVTVKKHLEKFIEKGVLNLKKERKFYFYSSNTENPSYKEIKRQYNRDKLINSNLIDFLKKEFNLPTIILFGSYEKGEDNKNSDVDICIITESRKDVDIKKYEKIINRKIQLHIFKNEEFKKLKIKNKNLFNSIINGYKIYGLLEI